MNAACVSNAWPLESIYTNIIPLQSQCESNVSSYRNSIK